MTLSLCGLHTAPHEPTDKENQHHRQCSSSLDVDALRVRQHMYQLQEAHRRSEAGKIAMVTQTRLHRNAAEVQELLITETVARDEVKVVEAIALEVVVAHQRIFEETLVARRQALLRRQEACDRKYSLRDNTVRCAEQDAERIAREEGAAALRREKEEHAKAVVARQAYLKAKESHEEEMRAARVFIVGDEFRRRQQTESDEIRSWRDLSTQEAAMRADAERRAYDRFINSDEQKQIAAERERKLAEEKAAVLKRENDFKKDQHRLVSRCTHSRAGTSVFVGPLAKKMCLICKVKFDDAQNIYIRMP